MGLFWTPPYQPTHAELIDLWFEPLKADPWMPDAGKIITYFRWFDTYYHVKFVSKTHTNRAKWLPIEWEWIFQYNDSTKEDIEKMLDFMDENRKEEE